MKKTLLTRVAVVGCALLSTSTAFAIATRFSDVPSNHWASDAIQWADHAGIMTGPADTPDQFDPAGVVNRAQLATVLYRINQTQNTDMVNLQQQVDLLQQRVEVLERKAGISTGNSSSSSSRSSSSSSFSSSSSSIRSSSSSSVSSVAGATSFGATLTAEQETPPTTSGGHGVATFTLSGTTLFYDASVAGLTGPITAAHIHTGNTGVAGPVLLGLSFSGTTLHGQLTQLSSSDLTTLRNGGTYINVHTNQYPNGEIRGQILAR